METKTTFIRISKDTRRLLRAASEMREIAITDLVSHLAETEAKMLEYRDPKMWRLFYARAADKSTTPPPDAG